MRVRASRRHRRRRRGALRRRPGLTEVVQLERHRRSSGASRRRRPTCRRRRARSIDICILRSRPRVVDPHRRPGSSRARTASSACLSAGALRGVRDARQRAVEIDASRCSASSSTPRSVSCPSTLHCRRRCPGGSRGSWSGPACWSSGRGRPSCSSTDRRSAGTRCRRRAASRDRPSGPAPTPCNVIAKRWCARSMTPEPVIVDGAVGPEARTSSCCSASRAVFASRRALAPPRAAAPARSSAAGAVAAGVPATCLRLRERLTAAARRPRARARGPGPGVRGNASSSPTRISVRRRRP